MHYGVKLICGFVLLLSLGACGKHIGPSPQLAELHYDDFTSALRWKQFKVAASLMQEEHRPAFLATFDAIKDIHIIDVRMIDVQMGEGSRHFDATLEMDYYLLPSVTVKTFRFDQRWEFRQGEEIMQTGYLIVTPFPEFP